MPLVASCLTTRRVRNKGGSPVATLFGTAAAGARTSSQANVKCILANQYAKDAACAIIAQVGGSFPQLHAAVLSKIGCGFVRAHVEDFAAVDLAEAAAELRS